MYLNPRSMWNNGLYGCYSGFRAIVLPTLGDLGSVNFA